ncbi:MAG TPA: methyltransferase domain-containing protein [Chitinophagaceae bacterium]|jgi:SAM-dependent methyltransferase|nr:methyltransferase domain-containing protein [Chitinophagaceae bacterium]
MKNINTAALVSRDRNNSQAWFKQWFDSSFYHQLYANRNEKEAASFIEALINELRPATNSRMLDLGCGNGRHSKYLGSKGFDVTGLDLASSSIRQAKRSETEKLHFYCHDMRMPFGRNTFDYVFNFFTSFGYFDDPSQDRKVVTNIYSALKPGGTLVMDYINSVHSEKKLVAAEKKEIDGLIYDITRWTTDTHFFKKIRIENIGLGEPVEHIERVKKFSADDLKDLFAHCGLQLESVYGDYFLNEYDVQTSPRLILIAKKISK